MHKVTNDFLEESYELLNKEFKKMRNIKKFLSW